MNILIGVTGSVSAKLYGKLYHELIKNGHNVKAIKTVAAQRLYPSLIGEVFDDESWYKLYEREKRVIHIELAQWADVFVICPCSANTLAKIESNLADNLLTSTVMAYDYYKKPLYIAPAMNTQMYANCCGVNFKSMILPPTVKKLECGAIGLGALADVYDIAKIVSGHSWKIDFVKQIFDKSVLKSRLNGSFYDHAGAFGSVRKHDIHAGVDLYCEEGSVVRAFEDGKVFSVGKFTGKEVGSPWWNETYYISIDGPSGRIVYGGIDVPRTLRKGNKIKAGFKIGTVKKILKKKPKEKIPGHKTSMLHIELIDSKSDVPFVECWNIGDPRPDYLKDPTVYLVDAWNKTQWNPCK